MTRSRVLIISTRRTSKLLGSSMIYEFEDAIAGFEDADVAEVLTTGGGIRLALTQRVNTAVRIATRGRFGNAGPIPWPADAIVDDDYELCVLLCDTIFNMRMINLIRHARERSKRVIVYVAEVWPDVFEAARIHTQPYALVDHFFIGTESSVARLAEVSGRPVTALATAVNARRFEPVLHWGDRPIGVTWPGRRLAPMHADVMRLVDEHGWLYYYDGFTSATTDDAASQREWLAYLMGRSRFSVSHYSRVDQPGLHRGNLVVAGRFFESTAAGNVLVGAAPDTPLFDALGRWQDSLIEIRTDEPRVDRILLELARDEARMAAISRRNVAFSLRQNDWGHRWASVLNALGMERPPRLTEHLDDLQRRADLWDAPGSLGGHAGGRLAPDTRQAAMASQSAGEATT